MPAVDMASARSIAVFCYREADPRFLLLKRVPAKGGFWQPVTGRVEATDGLIGSRARYARVIAGCRRASEAGEVAEREDLLVAALRELTEEIGVEDVLTVVDLGIESRFAGFDGVTYHERAFAAELPNDAEIVLSWEHEEAQWVDLDDALGLLHWDENKSALRALVSFLVADPETDAPHSSGPGDAADE